MPGLSPSLHPVGGADRELPGQEKYKGADLLRELRKADGADAGSHREETAAAVLSGQPDSFGGQLWLQYVLSILPEP